MFRTYFCKLTRRFAILLIVALCLPHYAQADLWTDIATGDLKAIKKGNHNVNARHPQNGSTPLITATIFQNHDVVRWLIKEGADVNMRGADGGTALHAAAFIGADRIAKKLLKAGASLDARNAAGAAALQMTYLDWQTTKGFLDVLNLPLTKKHIMNGRQRIQDHVATMIAKQAKNNLWVAVALGHTKSVRKLLRKGYEVNATDYSGTTPLQSASAFGHLQVVRILIEAGADVDQINPFNGSTALHAASLFGKAEVVKVLLDNGATREVFDYNGSLAIDAADLDWVATNAVAGLLQLKLDPKATMAGKAKTAQLLMQ